MPGAVSLTGADTLLIDGRVINDLADQDAVHIVFPNDLATAKASKNGNTIFAKDEKGRQSEVTVRVLLGSSDDKYLNSRLAQQNQDFSTFQLLTAMFSKRVGDGQGGMATKVHNCANGIFKKFPEAKTSAEGDADQSVAVYTLAFASTSESIQ
jgi:hypothetical protein